MKILFFDIETMQSIILFSFYSPEEGKWQEFEISRRKNDMYSFVKFMEEHRDYYFCGFNNVQFDSQVIEFFLRNYHKWYDYSSEEIMVLLYKKSQHIIDDINYEVFPPYKEEDISFRQIDLYKIPHFDNKAKRCSLKWLEFMMDMPDIQELPYDHKRDNLTNEEIDKVIAYCRNDILSTYKWFQYLTGNVEHETYKGKNEIQYRLDAISEFGLPPKAINFSNVKVGEEFNKMKYLSATGNTQEELYQIRRNRESTKKFTFGDCIPSYVTFKTPELQEFHKRIGKQRVILLDNTQEFQIPFRGTSYVIAKGGIHSTEENRVIIPTEEEILVDADVGSQYPNSIVKRELFPAHLSREWIDNYKKIIEIRLKYKAQSKDNPSYKGLVELLKYALNGGAYGKFNERTNWQYDPSALFHCTIGNQFEILMLIEMLELAGIHVVSANTDGIVSLFSKDLEKKYYEICHEWEEIVGNKEMGKLEYSEFKKLWQESVNHYIAIKADGKIKVKGRFCYEDELNKNNTDKVERITRKAIQLWVKEGKSVEDTIQSETNIFMFCIGKKASKDYRWETIDEKGGRTKYQKLIRFYISSIGEKLIKVKNEDSEAPGARITQFFRNEKVIICNKINVSRPIKDYPIDYQHYINNAKEIINKIEGKTNKKIIVNPLQTSLF